MGIRRGSISTPIIADGLVFNMDAANRASYPAQRTFTTAESGSCYNTIDLTQSGSFIADPQFITQPVSASCWAFDGIDDYIDCSNPFNNIIKGTNFTISIWFNSSVNASYDTLLSNGTPCQIYVESNKIKIWMGYPYLTNLNPFISSATLSLSTWYHLAFVKSGSNWYIYIDGTLDNTVSDSGTVSTSTVDLAIGIYPTSGIYPFQGNIANAQMYNRGLPANEVLHNYNALKGRFA